MIDIIRHMTNDQFVEFCYTTILGREGDEQGKRHYITALNNSTLSRDDLLLIFLTCEEFLKNVRNREFVPSGHFYSALPSREDRLNYQNNKRHDAQLLAININDRKQIELLENFR